MFESCRVSRAMRRGQAALRPPFFLTASHPKFTLGVDSSAPNVNRIYPACKFSCVRGGTGDSPFTARLAAVSAGREAPAARF